MKRAFTIWGVLSLIVWVFSLVTAESLNIRYVGGAIPMSFLLTLFPVMLIEGILVWRDRSREKKKF
ncbi:hypothetical protein [Tumebacillus permanentifrigoris]|uniref:Uncharacterized protein n=1 Tax=Tumebacillus permanentifrigoris TaxID=378543 RepID=A0A316DAF9_9BACL|nr:hypothetical protein [Tumebacillus permanentifrigoris]PWK13481.1 hypothetical protein C7459_107149 [Tumebacillus permanentifrigoris]